MCFVKRNSASFTCFLLQRTWEQLVQWTTSTSKNLPRGGLTQSHSLCRILLTHLWNFKAKFLRLLNQSFVQRNPWGTLCNCDFAEFAFHEVLKIHQFQCQDIKLKWLTYIFTCVCLESFEMWYWSRIERIWVGLTVWKMKYNMESKKQETSYVK